MRKSSEVSLNEISGKMKAVVFLNVHSLVTVSYGMGSHPISVDIGGGCE